MNRQVAGHEDRPTGEVEPGRGAGRGRRLEHERRGGVLPDGPNQHTPPQELDAVLSAGEDQLQRGAVRGSGDDCRGIGCQAPRDVHIVWPLEPQQALGSGSGHGSRRDPATATAGGRRHGERLGRPVDVQRDPRGGRGLAHRYGGSKGHVP